MRAYGESFGGEGVSQPALSRLLVTIPVVSVAALLFFILWKWEWFGYGRPLYAQFPLWLWDVVRPELEFGKLFYWGTGLLFLAAEFLWPARAINRRTQLSWDLSSYILGNISYQFAFLFFIVVLPGTGPALLGEAHTVVRVIMLLLMTDFLAYWSHRLRHTAPLWPMHRWHHASENLYWLSGNRTTLIDYVWLAGPSFLTFWLFSLSITEGIVVVSLYTLANHWAHANLQTGNRYLEWLIITPRFHRLHHSQAPEHFNSNFAVLFTIWDRIFGTFSDPDTTASEYPLGLPGNTAEKLRMMTGI
jgi:sterol desaturase/sphingolipid hydroxylase (fatty acid hydroxylase superfamily)